MNARNTAGMKVLIYLTVGVASILAQSCSKSGDASSDGGDTESETGSVGTSDGDSDVDTDSDGDADADGDSDTDTDADGDADGDSDGDADGDTDGDMDTDGDTDMDADTDGDTDTDSDGDADTDADTDVDTDTGSDTDSDVDIDSDTDSDADTDTGTGTDTGDKPPVGIPKTCEEAERTTTSVGCLFFAVDLEPSNTQSGYQFAVALSNVNEEVSATVSIYEGNDVTDDWDLVVEQEVAPMALEVFNLDGDLLSGTCLVQKGSYKIVSTAPIVAYQFNPVDGARSTASDASHLIPVSSLSLTYDVVGLPSRASSMNAHFAVAATADGTEVTVEPSTAPNPGGPVTDVGDASPFTVMLDEGDVLQVAPYGLVDVSMTGTRITSNPGHPVVLFSANRCTNIPSDVDTCDILEEQLPGMRFWGKKFVASRMSVRGVGSDHSTDNVSWQIYAGEDDTNISLTASPEVTGLPFETTTLSRGESVEMLVSGTDQNPGDFYISSDKPIAVLQYMTGSYGPNTGGLGDPAMVYVSPTEQFLSRYVVLVPANWVYDALVVTRTADVPVLLDGDPVDDALFTDVADTGYQVARIPVPDGVHTLESTDETKGISVIVVGYDDDDSYAYPGGMGIQPINPIMV